MSQEELFHINPTLEIEVDKDGCYSLPEITVYNFVRLAEYLDENCDNVTAVYWTSDRGFDEYSTYNVDTNSEVRKKEYYTNVVLFVQINDQVEYAFRNGEKLYFYPNKDLRVDISGMKTRKV